MSSITRPSSGNPSLELYEENLAKAQREYGD